MIPHEMLMIGREVYQERLDEAALQRRAVHVRREAPTMLDRTALYLGDLLINLGEHLKHQSDLQTTARSSRA
jgi:hypothetical protein